MHKKISTTRIIYLLIWQSVDESGGFAQNPHFIYTIFYPKNKGEQY